MADGSRAPAGGEALSGLGLDEGPDGGGAALDHRMELFPGGVVQSRELPSDDQPGVVVVDRLEARPADDRRRPVPDPHSHRPLRLELDDLHRALRGPVEAGDASTDDGPDSQVATRAGLELDRRIPARMVLHVMDRIEVPYDGDGTGDDRRSLE